MTSLTQEEFHIQRWLKKVGRANLKGRAFWRCIERRFAPAALESGPNFSQPSRYSVAGEFSAVYLSESQVLARLEKTQGYEDDFEPLEDIRFHLIAKVEVPDLTDRKSQSSMQEALEMDPRDLVMAGVDGYRRTHPIARAAFYAGLPGLLVPSVHPVSGEESGWRNLVAYPANILGELIGRR